MEENDMRLLLETSGRLIDEVSLDFRRYLFSRIEWGDRLICIKGPKGCGKTTLILQHIKETFGADGEKAVYLALDHIWFASHDVLDTVDWLQAHGCTHVFLDEVHRAQDKEDAHDPRGELSADSKHVGTLRQTRDRP